MWNEPSSDELALLPRLYASEDQSWEKTLVHTHFFLGGCDWYVTEYCPRTRLFFGFAILNGDLPNAEWGYTSFDELRAIRVGGVEVDRDLHWTPRPAGTIDGIRAAHGQTYGHKYGQKYGQKR